LYWERRRKDITVRTAAVITESWQPNYGAVLVLARVIHATELKLDDLTVYHSLLSSFLFPGRNISAFGLSTPGFATTLKLESSLRMHTQLFQSFG